MANLLKKENYNVGVVGSTGAVGEVVLELLEERKFPIDELKLFCSERSAGREQQFDGKTLRSERLTEDSFKELDLCFFSAGANISLEQIPRCIQDNCIAIDNTSAFRMREDVPLVVPEVNPEDLTLLEQTPIVAVPNCSTIQMVVALAPIHAQYQLNRVIVSTYQSTSGAGKRAMEELSQQVIALLNQKELKKDVFPHQIAFSCIPHIDRFGPNGYTREEMKIVEETRKILHAPELAVSATTVRVPTFCAHSESVYLETEWEIDVETIKELLAESPGIKVVDEPDQATYPVPFDAIGKDEVFVGRIRKDLHHPNGLHMWIVSDNLRKGAATNAIQIAEQLIAH